MTMRADKAEFRRRDFFVKWTMQRQKEIYQVYNFELVWGGTSASRIQFYAVPLGAWFKPRRLTQTREAILKDYAQEILEDYGNVLPAEKISGSFGSSGA